MAIRLVLAEEHGNNQRAAARLGVTDRALQIRRKAAACAAQLALSTQSTQSTQSANEIAPT